MFLERELFIREIMFMEQETWPCFTFPAVKAGRREKKKLDDKAEVKMQFSRSPFPTGPFPFFQGVQGWGHIEEYELHQPWMVKSQTGCSAGTQKQLVPDDLIVFCERE